ncbi:MAG: bifunctional methylenetetrahydrofolate dehydrogenase/methenyltetrahydrofolate cyclohydrolase FolD [Acetobacter sp.]|nr:bifunctional methylenetetrahydrofolate dehydrogenase/methenyltetrahydrofolate cyclohydrolase FolD [Acetobacter sp.]
MTAKILDGKALAQSIKKELKQKIAHLPSAPTLAVIIVGTDPASEIYVHNKEKACLNIGITPKTFSLPENTEENELIALITTLNNTPEINGILVQLPLPKHLNATKILQTISPIKDVDGFHPLNIGYLQQKNPAGFIPCTPKGIIKLLHTAKKDLSGLNAVVIGRSQIVGLPIAQLLLNENCTVTIAHSKTNNLATLCQSADILIAAVGKPELITKEYIKPDSLIIDVGINRTENGLKGDVNFQEAIKTAAYITPVPGGVGPMTIAMLLENTYEAYLKQTRP